MVQPTGGIREGEKGVGVSDDRTFSRREVVSMGFEASCVASDGTVYFWHRNFGVRIDRHTGQATLLMDSALLPDAPWAATRVGAKELEAAASENL
jgi:hypothetical protein